MIKSWVKINGPKDRDVFVDYDFTAPAGRTNEPFRVHSGTNTFMLVSRNLIIEARMKANVPATDEAHPFVVELWPAPLSSPTATTKTATGPRL
jgi:hypothetical protein